MSSTSSTAIATPESHVICAGATDRGRRRPRNEDCYGVSTDLGIFLVADGMGGSAAGEIAARMAVDAVLETFADAGAPGPERSASPLGAALPRLVAAVERANRRVHRASLRTPAYHGMGTTLAALLACGPWAVLAHVGDSRIYRLRGGDLAQLTADHSLFAELERAGLNPPREAVLYRSLITRAVGTKAEVDVEAQLVDAAPGDTFLLCSDGLCGVLAHDELAEILIAHADLGAAVERLVARANELGGPDNITAVLVRWDAAGGALRVCA